MRMKTPLGLLLAAMSALTQTHPALKLLENRCAGCHNSATRQSGLDLSTRDAAVRGGDRGPAIVPGRATESFLYKVLAHTEKPAMPKIGAKLSDVELALVAAWIDAGAPFETAPVTSAPRAPKPTHWAFTKPVRPTPPTPSNAAWVRNPIDAFLAAGHEQRKVTPMPPDDPRTLLRRAYLDLIGVPPTPREMDRFAGKYDEAVNALLDDPRYGERWGRHWMDIWRYSDWYGYRSANEVRNSHKFMWRWRDWIVESLNGDKPMTG